jgi:hypothetical protein
LALGTLAPPAAPLAAGLHGAGALTALSRRRMVSPASDWARTMTPAIVNISCGALID